MVVATPLTVAAPAPSMASALTVSVVPSRSSCEPTATETLPLVGFSVTATLV